jgi:hypothetical protein
MHLTVSRHPTNMLPAVLGAFYPWIFLHPYRTEFHSYHTQDACAWHDMAKMPLFPWTLYATAWIQLIATPIVGITLIMIVAERLLNIGFFDPALGGDPILYQHLFWIYSHPAVYIMILPGMGVISEIIPTFARKTIFGYQAIIVSTMAIAFVGYFVWGHHMFTSGNERSGTFYILNNDIPRSHTKCRQGFQLGVDTAQGLHQYADTPLLGIVIYFCIYDRGVQRTYSWCTFNKCPSS